MKPAITIVGAGPAGTSLAIRLAQKNFPVKLIERGKFPRQKLCGEFISPECFSHFADLSVLDQMFDAGGELIEETRFYSPAGKSVTVPSSWFGAGSALSLSRAEMDTRLLERARSVGVEVHERTAVVGQSFERERISGVKVRAEHDGGFEICGVLIVDATGRSRVLSKFALKQMHRSSRTVKTPAFVGFKTHLRNVGLKKGRCEIYFFRGGYGGLSGIEDGLANHCFLVRSDIVRTFNGNAERILKEVVFKNKRASAALESAEPVYDWLKVSIDGFGIRDLNPARNLFTVGDSAAFIDPFTGSGMLMALESAEILAGCINEHAGALETLAAQYKKLYGIRFKRRLRVCSLLRRVAFMPNLTGLVISGLSFSSRSTELLTRFTRPQISNS